jgi:hypothetical protein
MDRSMFVVSFLVLVSGCGAAQRPHVFAEGELPIAAGARLYFASEGRHGRQDLTVAITDTERSFAFDLACAHVEPPVAMSGASTSVGAAALENARSEYAVGCDERLTADDALPAFLISRHTLAALDHHEQTMLRVEHHGAAVALFPVGNETLDVRVDGRVTHIPTVHARGDGMDVWIADVGTPIVVRLVDHDRGLALSGIDTGRGAPRARP